MTTRIIRPRQGQCIWKWSDKLHLPVPKLLKLQLAGLARNSGIPLAALGYGIMQAAIENPAWLAEAMRLLQAKELQAEQEMEARRRREAA